MFPRSQLTSLEVLEILVYTASLIPFLTVARPGGFSNYFPRPSYQDAAVAAFFENFPNGTYAGLFNP